MKRIYWDSCIVIYRVQSILPWSRHIAARIDPDLDAVQLHVTTLTRLECRVFPIRRNDTALLERFEDFFAHPRVQTLDLNRRLFEQATELRAQHRLSTPDALHLAAAIDAGCEEFWTNDRRLERAAAKRIEVIAFTDEPSDNDATR